MSKPLVDHFSELMAWRRRYGYVELMISVFILIIAAQLTRPSEVSDALIATLSAVSLISACLAISNTEMALRKNLLVALVGTTAWVSSHAVDSHPFNSDPFRIAILLYAFVFIAFVGIVILRDIFRPPVTGNRICGAICVYLLVGVAFAILHATVFLLDPGAYVYSNPNPTEGALRPGGGVMSYFSFCTLSTLGYGDIIPIHKFARSLCWIESVMGQLYLSILVARLVGLYISDEAARRARLGADADRDEDESEFDTIGT